MSNKFLYILSASLVVYFVLDYLLKNMMLYIMGGVIGGSITEAFKAVGIKAGIGLIGLIWIGLLVGIVILYYKTTNNTIKYILVAVIGALLYVVDLLVGSIGENYMSDSEEINRIAFVGNFVLGVTILLKSILLSVIIYTGIVKN